MPETALIGRQIYQILYIKSIDYFIFRQLKYFHTQNVDKLKNKRHF